jgi:hypothetical protein
MSQTPIVAFNGAKYTITLFRNGVPITEIFDHPFITVKAHPEKNCTSELLALGPLAADGLLYYFHASCPRDLLAPAYVWLKDNDEALAVEKGVHEAAVNHYEYAFSLLDEQSAALCAEQVAETCGDDVVCTFCWKTPRNGCSEDHGDDMRDWQREVLERD